MGALLTMMALLGVGADGPTPEELVRQLGAGEFALRESASKALTALGPEALPALRKASAAPDAEVRERAGQLVEAIERAEQVGGRPVVLDFQGTPLSEVARVLGERSGTTVRLGDPGANPMVGLGGPPPGGPGERLDRSRPIDLVSESPVPYWEAIDRFCAAGGLVVLQRGLMRDEGRTLDLVPGRAPECPTSYAGGVRLRLLQINEAQHRSTLGAFDRKRPRVQVVQDLKTRSLQFDVDAHPGAWIESAAILLAEALDEEGRDLKSPDGRNAGASANFPLGARTSIMGRALVLPIQWAEAPPKAFRSIKGRLTLVVTGDRLGGTEVVIADHVGKEVKAGEQSFFVEANRPGEELRLRFDQAPREVRPPDLRLEMIGGARPDRLFGPMGRSLEFLDDQGRRCSPSSTMGQGIGGQMTFTYRAFAPAWPTKVRAQARFKATMELPFEFKDVPVPSLPE